MTNSNTKSLSVNYGSFSITIEGFEDPFALMKRVTDYFQRVASRDPQFGARPLDQDAQVFENLSDILASEEIEVVRSNSDFLFRPEEKETAPMADEPAAVPFVSSYSAAPETDEEEPRKLRIIRPSITELVADEEEVPTPASFDMPQVVEDAPMYDETAMDEAQSADMDAQISEDLSVEIEPEAPEEDAPAAELAPMALDPIALEALIIASDEADEAELPTEDADLPPLTLQNALEETTQEDVEVVNPFKRYPATNKAMLEQPEASEAKATPAEKPEADDIAKSFRRLTAS